MTRYLSGLCVAGLGLCGGGWLVVAAVAFGGESAGGAGRVNLATGAGLILASCVALVVLGGGLAAADAHGRRARPTVSCSCPGARRGGTGGSWPGTSGALPGWRSGRPGRPGAARAVGPAGGRRRLPSSRRHGAAGHGTRVTGSRFSGDGHAFGAAAFNGHGADRGRMERGRAVRQRAT